MEYRCPVCKKTFKTSAKEPTKQAPFFPFCSQRCKLIDLGAWLDVEYKITSETQPENSKGSSEEPPHDSEKE